MRSFSTVLVLLATLLFGACSKPSQPTLLPKRATITSVTLAGIDFVVLLSVTNPNSVALSARSVSATVTVDQSLSLGKVTVSRPLDLPAKSTTDLEAPLSLRWTDVPMLAALAAQNRDVA